MTNYPDVHRKYQICLEENRFNLIKFPVGQEEGGSAKYMSTDYGELLSNLTRELADTLHFGLCNTFYDVKIEPKLKDTLSESQVKTIEQLVEMRNEVSRLKRTIYDATAFLGGSMEKKRV